MRCITITRYINGFSRSPIFAVTHLSDRAFNNGFRILNPEYNTRSDLIERDQEALIEYLNKIDEQAPSQLPIRMRPRLSLRTDPSRRSI